MKRRNFFKSVGLITAAAYVDPVLIANPTLANNFSLNQDILTKWGPDDGPNQPMGQPVGVIPGRVVWAWNPKATNPDLNPDDYYFKSENYDMEAISKMLSDSVKKLSGKQTVAKSWDSMFTYFNNRKQLGNKGYTPGEKIFIKINQTSSRGRLNKQSRSEGKYYGPPVPPADMLKRTGNGVLETTPYVVLGILRQLVNECGIEESDISVGDPQNPIYGHNYDIWFKEFPKVVYADNMFGTYGRTLIRPSANDLIFYSDKSQSDKFYDVCENASYMINIPNLKPHLRSGITLTAKNHFGSNTRSGASHLHYSLVSPIAEAKPTNTGYRKYRVFVDILGSKYLGQNTILCVVDGLYGGGASEGGQPVKYFMPPFNNNWSSSIFMSQDPVALESVCYDFLRNEWNGTYIHDPRNARIETMPYVNGVDDYLHQAADKSNWPEDIVYDPDNSGRPLASLGVHEHWNNAELKQYSRNLGKSVGIELISIPENLVKQKK
jgi:hypothetical protein